MPKAFYHEQSVEVDGEKLQLVINFQALDAIEGLLDCSFNDVLAEFQAGNPKLGLVGRVLWGLLREQHPDITLDETASLMFGDTGEVMGLAVSNLLDAALPAAKKKPEAKDENPPKRRGASSPS